MRPVPGLGNGRNGVIVVVVQLIFYELQFVLRFGVGGGETCKNLIITLKSIQITLINSRFPISIPVKK